MNGSSTARWAPLFGVLAPILWFIGVAVEDSGGLEDDATADQILAFFEDNTGSILLGSVLFMLGSLALMVFVTVLRSKWRAAGAPDDAAGLAFGTGLLGAAFLAAAWAPELGVGVAIEDFDAGLQAATAEAAWHLGTGLFVVGELILALFLFATAAVSMRVPVLPKWLAWIGVVLGVVALIPPIGWAAIIFGLPVWLLIAGILVTVKGSTTAPSVTSN